MPRCRASQTSATESGLERWTKYTGLPVTRLKKRQRLTASDSATAGGGRAAAADEVVGGAPAAGVEGEVGVRVDQARQDVEPGGVERLGVGVGRLAVEQVGRHPPVLDDDVDLPLAIRVDEGPPADEQLLCRLELESDVLGALPEDD